MTFSFLLLFIFVPLMLGLYYITLAIWELRTGVDRTRFVKLMFGGLVLVVIAPLLFVSFWTVGMYALNFN